MRKHKDDTAPKPTDHKYTDSTTPKPTNTDSTTPKPTDRIHLTAIKTMLDITWRRGPVSKPARV